MAEYADVEDVIKRYERAADPAVVQVHLDDAERELLRLVPDLPARLAAGSVDAGDVAYVLGVAVRRYLRNPEGYTYEVAGDRAVNRGSAEIVAAGQIVFTSGDLARFRDEPSTAAGRMTVQTPLRRDRVPYPTRRPSWRESWHR